MKFNKLASTILILTVIGNLSLPAFADEELMVLPPVDNESVQNYQQTNYRQPAYNSSVLKGTVTTVPVGTTFEVITNSEINSQRNHVGEFFSATLNQPVLIGNDIIVPAGSEVFGQITYSEDAGKIGKNANMEIKFTAIKPLNGNKIPMIGKILTKDGSGILKGGTAKEQLIKNTAYVGAAAAGGLAAGAGIGAIAGHAGTGAVIGTSIAAPIGLAYIIMRKGKEVNLPVGTKMIISLEQPLTVGQ